MTPRVPVCGYLFSPDLSFCKNLDPRCFLLDLSRVNWGKKNCLDRHTVFWTIMCALFTGCFQEPRELIANRRAPSRTHPPAQRPPGRGASGGTLTSALRTPELRRRGAASRPFTPWLAGSPVSRSRTPAASTTSAARGGPRAPENATTPLGHKLIILVSVRNCPLYLIT
jgi:hypothetical protein